MTEPFKITEPGKYRTRDGRVAIVERLTNSDFPLAGSIDGVYESWRHTGEYAMSGINRRDIISRITEPDMTTTAKPFDPTKPFQTRAGLPARLLTSDINGPQPLAVRYTRDNGHEEVATFSMNGCYYTDGEESIYDLVNIPEKRTIHGYLNLYPEGIGCFYPTKENADEFNNKQYRIACIEINQEYEVE